MAPSLSTVSCPQDAPQEYPAYVFSSDSEEGDRSRSPDNTAIAVVGNVNQIGLPISVRNQACVARGVAQKINRTYNVGPRELVSEN